MPGITVEIAESLKKLDFLSFLVVEFRAVNGIAAMDGWEGNRKKVLSIRVLGSLAVEADGRKLTLPPSKKTRALFAYLVVTGRPHRRDRLCDLLWDVPDDPRGALRWSLSKLRTLIDEAATRHIVADRETVAFRAENTTCDLLAIRSDIGHNPATAPTESLRRAAPAFVGDFLEGLELTDCHKFHAWCVAEREEARALHAKVLSALIDRLSDAPEAALEHARALSRVEPGNEHAWAMLIHLLVECGRKREAAEVYNTADRALGDFGAPRTGELLALWRRLRTRPAAAPAAPAELSVVPAVESPEIMEPTQATEPERKQISALWVAIDRAPSSGRPADPEELLRRHDELLRAVTDTVGRFEGFVMSHGSDGILAVFGAPIAHEDHAERACRAALAIAAAGLGNHDRDSLCVAVHSGEAVVRTGATTSGAYEAIGPVVQIVRTFTGAAEPGVPVVSAETARRAEGMIAVRPLGASRAKDFGQPIDLFALIGSAQQTRWQARARRAHAAFVGRTGDLVTLGNSLAAAGSGRGQIVAVVGEAGVGKSRLVHELLASRQAADWTVMEGSCSPGDRDVAFAPLVGMLRAWLGVSRQDSGTEIARRLARRIEEWGHGLRAAQPPLLALLDRPVDDKEWLALGAPLRRQRSIDALKLLIARASMDDPLVVLIEDAHWIDQATQGFLDGLVPTISSLHVLLVVTYRPEYRHEWANRPNYAQCRIEPLPAESAIELLGSLLGAGPHLDGIKRSIADRSGGNPFFIEEIVRSLDEAGVLSRPPGEHVNFDEVAIAVPPTVQDVLAGRIDRLTAEAKRVLQAAAAVGRNVPYALLRAVTESDDERLAAALAALEAADFVHESRVFPERELTFKHALTRQVAYGAMTNAQRRAMHLKIAAAMLRTAADRVSEDVESLAAHFAEGESWPQAVDYLLRAARKAKLQYAYDAALAFSRRARAAAAVAGLAKRQVEAAIAEGDLLSLLGQLEPANAGYDAALALETDPMQRRRIANRRHEARQIVRDGGRVVYYEHGSGEETLVFVHPFVYGLSTFQPIVEQLCQEFRVVTIDPRGTGASDPLPPDYDIGDHMLDVAAVIEALPVKSVTAIGLSRGANLLIRLAVARPTLLRRLVLVGAHTRQTVGIGVDPDANMSMTHDALNEFVAALHRGNIRQAATIFAAKIFSEAGTDELRRQFIQRCVDLPPETVVRFFTFDPKADVENLLDKVDTPTLVMHGSRDDDVSLVTGIEIAQRIAKADLYVFEGKGHLPMFTATGEFCTTLRNFVRQGRARVPLAI